LDGNCSHIGNFLEFSPLLFSTKHFKHYNSDGYDEGTDKFISCKFKIFIFNARTEHANQDNNQNITRLEHDDNGKAYKNNGCVVGNRRDKNYSGTNDAGGFGDGRDRVGLEKDFVVDETKKKDE
jgi:hypothetical protein